MRLKIDITGLVQGVGFRPFVFKLAEELGLKGYVLNNATGVLIEVEGEEGKLSEFLLRLDSEKPDISRIFSLQHAFLEESGFTGFEIRKSMDKGDKRVFILPDISACEECLRDVTEPRDRRFLYPFTNCTNCGPRFTIIEKLPYDRRNTSMKNFSMCPACKKEYHMDSDRRFHAQPIACWACGPWISLYDREGQVLCEKESALEKTVNLIRKGYIIAAKGIGGYHLICDATTEDTVRRLRERKHREEKPLAVMFPDIEAIRQEMNITPLEERAITSIEKPVVIVEKKASTSLAASVSPGYRSAGVFLPYTPMHYLILRKFRKPVVATSANISDEPIVADEADAFARLSGTADYFLTHNRRILRRCDDSVVRIAAGRQMPVRRSRGFAPLPVTVPFKLKKPVLALGAYMNSTIALGIDDRVFISQHIGDLDTPLAMEFYEQAVEDFLGLFRIKPEVVVSDMHPGYYSTKYGERRFQDMLLKVQHHYAHILSCMAENGVAGHTEVIGFAFDGTGYAPDGTIWGGEVLTASYSGFKRVFHLSPYRLPGGDRAVKEPYRSAISLLYETLGEGAAETDVLPLSQEKRLFFINMIKNDINSPVTTSMGRLFDAVASITGLRHRVSYHAQAAAELEQLALGSDEKGSYAFSIEKDTIVHTPMLGMILDDLKAGVPKEDIARKFHNTIVEIIVSTAESIRKETGISHAALSGGVFQNTILLENAFNALKERGFVPLTHQLVPPNDGGIALGQAAFAGRHVKMP
ncbi:MAG: carbamoyltransferase HypF [Deferribacteres bacterium]|nr:carbamoyltransferase HypF [Deferribacteres bacterium]